MDKPPHLPIPLPLYYIHKTSHRILRAPRAILQLIRRTKITHRKPRIIRENLNPLLLPLLDRLPLDVVVQPVLHILACHQHVHRHLARPVRLRLDLVHGRLGRQAAPDRARAGGDVDDARVCALAEQTNQRFGEEVRACGIGVEGVAEGLAVGCGVRRHGGVVHEHVQAAVVGGDGACGVGNGGVILEVEVQEFDASRVVLGLQGAEGCGAPVWGAGAKEDVVGAFGEELAGEFEADAAVCCGLLVMTICELV